MTNITVTQLAEEDRDTPPCNRIEDWLSAIVAAYDKPVDYDIEVTLISNADMARVHADFLGKDRPTNALAFPGGASEDPDNQQSSPLIGEILVAPSVMHAESEQLGIAASDHWGHVLAHAFLHLEGYDHTTSHEAEAMFHVERKLVTTIGMEDPHPELASAARQ